MQAEAKSADASALTSERDALRNKLAAAKAEHDAAEQSLQGQLGASKLDADAKRAEVTGLARDLEGLRMEGAAAKGRHDAADKVLYICTTLQPRTP
jgi:hypothetical protein